MSNATCPVCGGPSYRSGGCWRYCWACYEAVQPLQSKALRKVANAVKTGRLLSPKTLGCADCGRIADRYTHRDYEKPLEVEAVCHDCNFKRGPAKQWMPGARFPE